MVGGVGSTRGQDHEQKRGHLQESQRHPRRFTISYRATVSKGSKSLSSHFCASVGNASDLQLIASTIAINQRDDQGSIARTRVFDRRDSVLKTMTHRFSKCSIGDGIAGRRFGSLMQQSIHHT
ncbi:hypothetical protein PIB30_087024 [Stylosanthes scabra]|uniref:Uncharacterized protein n=1 Tax=Stylosanthes scabra TaxID=79078 RepID=A0ABU6TSV0_9FABA|nr:hypothetical protein [Stylosanthes scabra]